jgi:hypothetical protein
MQSDVDQILVDVNAIGGQEEHAPLFPGTIRYVTTDGDDANDGLTPSTAMLTWGVAIAASSPGDAISVKAGTYTETGLDMNVVGLQLWPELGVVLDPATGTALTISANFCQIVGAHKITPAAGAIGVLVSGSECIIASSKILTGATGIRVTGAGVVLNECAAGQQTAIAFDLQGAQGRMYRCKTVGVGATTGYKISNGADTGVLEQCTSVGHVTSGFYIDTGSQDWTLLSCSSGAGDGRWVDVDSANVWSDFRYADEVVKLTTFAGIPTTYNMFKVTGAVRVSDIHGHVETVIPNTASTIHLELYSSNGPVDITLGPGVDLDQAVAGALLVRNGASTDALDLADPNSLPAVAENTTWKDPKTVIDVVKDDSADTYIRLVLSAALASGAIHWHAHYEPLSDDGFLEPV